MRRRHGPSCSLPRTSRRCCGSLRARLRAGARPARSKRSESDAGGAFPRRPFGRWCPRRSARSGRTAPGARPTRPIPLSTPEPRADGGSAAQLNAPMREDGQRFPAWPLITAVVRHSQRTGCYTARIDYPSAPARLLRRPELQPLRGEVITQVQRWANDEWHKPVRLEVDDPDGRWLLGIPRDGAPVELDALAPDPPVSPAPAHRSALPAPAGRPPARFTLPVSAPIRRGRLAALAGVVLAAVAVVVVLAGALPGGSSAVRRHQALATHAAAHTAAATIVAARTAAIDPRPTTATSRRSSRRSRPAVRRARRAVHHRPPHRSLTRRPRRRHRPARALPATPATAAPRSAAPASSFTPHPATPASSATPSLPSSQTQPAQPIRSEGRPVSPLPAPPAGPPPL